MKFKSEIIRNCDSVYLTSKPSSRKQILCKSISFWQSGSSSPLNTTHSSRAFFVSGQQQQIGFPVLMPSFFFGFSTSWKIIARHKKGARSTRKTEQWMGRHGGWAVIWRETLIWTASDSTFGARKAWTYRGYRTSLSHFRFLRVQSFSFCFGLNGKHFFRNEKGVVQVVKRRF